MSLKTDYGLSAALNTAYLAGYRYVLGTCSTLGYSTQSECTLGGGIWTPSSAYATLQTELANAAAMGKTDFTVTVPVTHAPTTLRLKNKYWEAFRDGVMAALASEDIYSYEVDIQLNTSDTLTTSIDFNFTF